jgi:hypothetical protein
LSTDYDLTANLVFSPSWVCWRSVLVLIFEIMSELK